MEHLNIVTSSSRSKCSWGVLHSRQFGLPLSRRADVHNVMLTSCGQSHLVAEVIGLKLSLAVHTGWQNQLLSKYLYYYKYNDAVPDCNFRYVLITLNSAHNSCNVRFV